MPNINCKTYIDIHSTGQKKEFGSIKQYDKFLKENNLQVLSKKDLEMIKERKSPKSDYKKVVAEAWVERKKYLPQIKLQIAKENYMRRNGRLP